MNSNTSMLLYKACARFSKNALLFFHACCSGPDVQSSKFLGVYKVVIGCHRTQTVPVAIDILTDSFFWVTNVLVYVWSAGF